MSETAAELEQARQSPEWATVAAFVGFILLAGGAAIAVRTTYQELAPFWSGTFRFALAALIFWLLIIWQKIPLPPRRAFIGALLFGTLNVGVAFIFVYYGLTETPASLFQTITAIVPLLTIFFAAAHKLEPLRRRGVAGALLAVVGIAIAVSGSLSSGVELSTPHLIAIIFGAACFAEAGIIIKLFPPCHPYTTNAIAMTIGSVILAAASLIAGEPWVIPSSLPVWTAMTYLVLGTVVAFILYLFVMGRWTASTVSYSFVLVPIVTVVLASVLTDETISLIFLAGAAVVLIGVYVGAIHSPDEAAIAAEPEKVPETVEEELLEDIQARPGTPICA